MPKMSTHNSERDFSTQDHQLYPPYAHRSPAGGEVDLSELWDAIWRGKWLILGVICIFAVGSIIVAVSLPNIYRSETLLAPSEDAQGGGLSGMANQLGGLASLAGINLGGSGGQNKVDVAIEVLKSRQFISRFIERYNILPILMAVDGWDPSADKMHYDSDIYDELKNQWVRDVEPPQVPKPSEWEAYEAFMDVLTVTQDNNTGFVTVAVEHFSPVIAQKWTELLVKEVNEVIKKKDVNEAQRSIDYLQNKMSEVPLAEMRSVFYQLIEEQTKTIMLAEVREEYVFSTIDPPVVPEEKEKPKRMLICVLGILLGGIFSVVSILIRYLMQKNKRLYL